MHASLVHLVLKINEIFLVIFLDYDEKIMIKKTYLLKQIPSAINSYYHYCVRFLLTFYKYIVNVTGLETLVFQNKYKSAVF